MALTLSELTAFGDFYHQKLFDDCLPFWIKNCVDREFGGFITSLDQDGTIVDTDKGVWQQGRFTWLLGELFNDPRLANDPSRNRWSLLATHGGKFLKDFCFDSSDGRMWFHLNQQGNPIRKRRYSFSESFAAIAFGELAKANGDDSFSVLANSCFTEFLQRSSSPPNSGSKFTNLRQTIGIGFPMISIVTAQQLRDSIGLENANDVIDRSIALIEKYFVKPDLKCVMESVSPTGDIIDHFDGRTLNPGHAIEAAWFIISEGIHRNDQRLKKLGCGIFDWMFERGWDQKHGGLLYFVDLHGGPVQEYWHEMKFWWPHCEAIIAALFAFVATNDPKYLLIHKQIHDWAFDHFTDPEYGEWFGYLRRDGSISSTLKGNLWKGPFHYPRMLLTCWRILHDLIENESNSQ